MFVSKVIKAALACVAGANALSLRGANNSRPAAAALRAPLPVGLRALAAPRPSSRGSSPRHVARRGRWGGARRRAAPEACP